MATKNEPDRDYIGGFLVDIYYKSFFDSKKFGKIDKHVLEREFYNYKCKDNLPYKPTKIGEYLRKYDFLHRNANTYFLLNSKTFFQFRCDFIRKLDEKRLAQDSFDITTNNDNSENNEIIEIDPDSPIHRLEYKKGTVKSSNRKTFVGTTTSCFICQEEFADLNDLDDHIVYHGQDSGFKALEEFDNIMPKHLTISYRLCKNSYYIHFTIENENFEEIEIKKIVIVLSSAMTYVHDDRVPFNMKPKSKDIFYTDCHLLQINVEQPFVIIFRYKDDPIQTRRIEQHHFLRETKFPVNKMVLKSSRVLRRCQIDLKNKLLDYYPSALIKAVSNTNYSDIALNSLGAIFKEYMDSKNLLSEDNIHIVLEILLQLEDDFQQKMYSKLRETNKRIKRFQNDYSIELNKVPNVDVLQEGDEIILKTENDKKTRVGIINRISRASIYFMPKNYSPPFPDLKYSVSFRSGRIPIRLQYRALKMLAHKKCLRNFLFPMENSNKSPSTLSLDWYSKTIRTNPEQMQAVRNIVDKPTCNAPYIIFGPPGTGKTTTIVEAVLQLWKMQPHSRILITAGSNAACDEVGKRLCHELSNIAATDNCNNILRIYAAAVLKRSENLDDVLIEASNLAFGDHFYPSQDIIYDYRIIIATLTVIGTLSRAPLSDQHFTHIFIDECGASTESESLIPIATVMSHNCRLILSGDPKQLGPVLKNKQAEKLGLGQSLLERLLNRKCYENNNGYDRSIHTRLIRNYRTHPDILYFSNTLYYGGDLLSCATPSITNWALNWCRLPTSQFPIVFKEVTGYTERGPNTTSLCNFKEIFAVLDYVRDILYMGINGREIKEKDIGIISPYKKQCDLIQSELNKRKWFQIETGSVETFQGKEKPIIIISMVRSNTGSLGFLDNPKRLNVSLTRAQALLIIVGNSETLKKLPDWEFVIGHCEKNNAIVRPAKVPQNKNLNVTTDISNSMTNLTLKSNRNKNMSKLTNVSKCPSTSSLENIERRLENLSNKSEKSNSNEIPKLLPSSSSTLNNNSSSDRATLSSLSKPSSISGQTTIIPNKSSNHFNEKKTITTMIVHPIENKSIASIRPNSFQTYQTKPMQPVQPKPIQYIQPRSNIFEHKPSSIERPPYQSPTSSDFVYQSQSTISNFFSGLKGFEESTKKKEKSCIIS